MAEQTTHDVLKEAKSVGAASPIDDSATPTTTSDAGHGHGKENLDPSNHGGDDGARLGSDGARSASPGTGGAVVPEPPSAAAVAAAVQQLAVADASGGSDTDTSRGDPSKPGHVRSGSMKKPAAFKSVSVTKNFLAKTATTPPARMGDKGASPTPSSAQNAAKPRLVAKSGGVGGLSRGGKLNGGSPGPDASKVWNKNQPVPPPPPKQFTDEELKQQYGIHMATRLQADESGKESKWADIEDDDEDDWAPETVEWMDGTKTSGAMPVSEPAPPPPPVEQKLPTPPKDEKPAAKPSPKPTLSSTTRTILKPGAHALGSGLRSDSGTGRSDQKPTLAKPSQSAAVKSPWAPLPPIERVSPVQIHPQPQPQGRYPPQDSRYAAGPSPAKEIAADDFNRSWRGSDTGAKELYNSHSGRYEPVNEGRRGSRHEHGGYRQTAVLQRPGQAGPAEPSAAFQTSRSSADGQTWARRRTGSNVSSGSGPHGRRVSFSRPDLGDMHGAMRRGSHASSEVFTPGGTGRSPFMQHRVPFIDRVASPNDVAVSYASSSPTGSHVQPVPPPGVPGADTELASPSADAVEQQKVLMRAKIEAARLAKQREREAEEAEETARKERLRLKLAALSPAPEPKPTPSVEEPKEEKGERSVKEKPSQAALPQPSPPKPPIPTAAEGGVAQYGLMKVHQAQPLKKYAGGHGQQQSSGETVPWSQRRGQMSSPSKAAAQLAQGARGDSQGPQRPTAEDTRQLSGDGANSAAASATHGPGQSTSHGPSSKAPATGWSVGGGQNRPDLAASWGDRNISGSLSSNVWGPPNKDNRGLGNGTFGAAYSQIPAAPHSMRGAMGNQARSGHDNNTGFASAQSANAYVQPRGESTFEKSESGSGRVAVNEFTFPSEPPPTAEFLQNSHPSRPFTDSIPATSSSRFASTSSSLHHPQPAASDRQSSYNTSTPHPSSLSHYNSTMASLPSDSNDGSAPLPVPDWNAALKNNGFATPEEALAYGLKKFEEESKKPEIKHRATFKQTSTAGPRTAAYLRQRALAEAKSAGLELPLEPVATTTSDYVPPHLRDTTDAGKTEQKKSDYVPPHLRSQQQREASAASTQAQVQGKPKASSRFFPAALNPAEDAEGLAETISQLIGDSPLPDDLAHGHPAFDGAEQAPRVRVPRPHPVVNLPGRNRHVQESTSDAKTLEIVDKIQALLGLDLKSPRPIGTARGAPVQPVASATKAEIEQVGDSNGTTVNLPATKGTTAIAEKEKKFESDRWAVTPFTKPAAIEEVVEEPQFGSTPRVAPPRHAHTNATTHPGAPVVFQAQGRAPRPVTATTRGARTPSPNEDANGRFVRVGFCGRPSRRVTVNPGPTPLRTGSGRGPRAAPGQFSYGSYGPARPASSHAASNAASGGAGHANAGGSGNGEQKGNWHPRGKRGGRAVQRGKRTKAVAAEDAAAPAAN